MPRGCGKIAVTVLVALLALSGAGCEEPPPPPEECDELPLALGEMPDLAMLVGDRLETSLLDYFGHPCRWELSYAATSGDSAVTVSISETVLTTRAIAVADSVRVNVTATDTTDNAATQDFYVSVEEPDQRNRAPVVVGSIPDEAVQGLLARGGQRVRTPQSP